MKTEKHKNYTKFFKRGDISIIQIKSDSKWRSILAPLNADCWPGLENSRYLYILLNSSSWQPLRQALHTPPRPLKKTLMKEVRMDKQYPHSGSVECHSGWTIRRWPKGIIWLQASRQGTGGAVREVFFWGSGELIQSI